MFSATKFVVAGVIVAIFGSFLLSGVLTQRSEESLPVGASASASAQASPIVTDVIDVGGDGWRPMAASEGAIWVTGPEGATVSRIGTETRQVTDTIPVESPPHRMMPTADALWVLGEDGVLSRIDATTRAMSEPIDATFARLGATNGWGKAAMVGDGSLWLQRTSGGPDYSLVEVDVLRQQIANEYPLPRPGAWTWMAEIDEAIWLWTRDDGSGQQWLTRFDLRTRDFSYLSDEVQASRYWDPVATHDAIWWNGLSPRIVERFDVRQSVVTDTLRIGGVGVGFDLESAVVGDGAIWGRYEDSVRRIDLATREVTDVIPAPDADGRLVFADGAVWVAARSRPRSKVLRIDTETRDVSDEIEIGEVPRQLLAVDGDVWVLSEGGTVTRIATGAAIEDEVAPEPLTVSESTDPEDTTTPDLLPGVDLNTEEVEQGVYQVLDDGVRALGWDLASMELPEQPEVVTTDGDVWLVLGEAATRLGDSAEYRVDALADLPHEISGASGMSGVG